MERVAESTLRLPELIAALTLGIDVGLGQPTEHVLRSCLIALRLSESIDASPSEREAAYYVALLSSVGCTADASELAAWFGDDNAFRSATYGVDLAGLPLFGFMLRRAGTGGSPWHRVRKTAALFAEGNRGGAESMASYCDVAATLAERLGLGPSLYEPMRQLFARWDGKGEPRLRGEAIALSVRLVQLADIVEAHRSADGPETALAVARKRAGTQFDPMLVAQLERHADDVFADLKSPYFRGHSRGVAALAADAAAQLGLPASETVTVRRAALLHDLGRTGVPNTVWDKPGALTESERERVRLHPYYTERALARPAALARLGAIAGAHHERLDGSGYHRGLTGASISPPARVLAAADACTR